MVIPNSVLAEVLAKEGGGKWNALYGQAQDDPNSPFYGVDVTRMTLNEVADFTNPSGPYAQYVKSRVGRVATPTGGGQIVGATLRQAMADLGLTGNEIYDPAMQKRLMDHIYDTQGPGAWVALGQGGGGGGGGGNTFSMSTKGAPAMTPYTERQSVIKQLLGGEGIKGKLGPLFNPLEGANPRLEEERFLSKMARFNQIQNQNAYQMTNTNAPVSFLQTLAGIGSGIGSQVMGGAAERAGGMRDSQLQELLATGAMTPDVLARIAALDPEYGQAMMNQQRQFEQQATLQAQSQEFNMMRDQAQRDHEIAMAQLAPEDRTAMEKQLIAAGFDPNEPPGEDGLNEFQRQMRKQIEGAGSDAPVTIVMSPDGKPMVVQGPGAAAAGAAMGGGTAAGTGAAPGDISGVGKIEPGMAQGVGPDGAIVQAPIPGSPEDVKRQKDAEAAKNAENTELKTATDVLSAIDQVENIADSFFATGAPGKLLRDIGIGGTPAMDIEIALRPVIANMGFDRLQQMRAASATGAALGQVTERENTLLQSTIKSLDPNGSKELFKQNLAYIKEQYDVIVNTDPNNPEDVARYERVMGFPLEARGGGTIAPTATQPVNPSPAAPAPAVQTPAPAPQVPQTQPTGPVSIGSDAEYDALPSGTQFIDPNGIMRVKP